VDIIIIMSLQVLMNFVGSCDGTSEFFMVKLPGSTTALDSSLIGSTLEQNGLMQSLTLHVICLDGAEVICLF